MSDDASVDEMLVDEQSHQSLSPGTEQYVEIARRLLDRSTRISSHRNGDEEKSSMDDDDDDDDDDDEQECARHRPQVSHGQLRAAIDKRMRIAADARADNSDEKCQSINASILPGSDETIRTLLQPSSSFAVARIARLLSTRSRAMNQRRWSLAVKRREIRLLQALNCENGGNIKTQVCQTLFTFNPDYVSRAADAQYKPVLHAILCDIFAERLPSVPLAVANQVKRYLARDPKRTQVFSPDLPLGVLSSVGYLDHCDARELDVATANMPDSVRALFSRLSELHADCDRKVDAIVRELKRADSTFLQSFWYTTFADTFDRFEYPGNDRSRLERYYQHASNHQWSVAKKDELGQTQASDADKRVERLWRARQRQYAEAIGEPLIKNTAYAQLPLLTAIVNEALPREYLLGANGSVDGPLPAFIASNADMFRRLYAKVPVLYAVTNVDGMFGKMVAEPGSEQFRRAQKIYSTDANEMIDERERAARDFFFSTYFGSGDGASDVDGLWTNVLPIQLSSLFTWLELECAATECLLLRRFIDDAYRDYCHRHRQCWHEREQEADDETARAKCATNVSSRHYCTSDEFAADQFVALQFDRSRVRLGDLYYTLYTYYERFSERANIPVFADGRHESADVYQSEQRLDDDDDDDEAKSEDDHERFFDDGSFRQSLERLCNSDGVYRKCEQAFERAQRHLTSLESETTSARRRGTKKQQQERNEKMQKLRKRMQAIDHDRMARLDELRRQQVLESVYRASMRAQARRIQRFILQSYVVGALDGRYCYLVIRRELLPIFRSLALGCSLTRSVRRRTGASRAMPPLFPLLVRSVTLLQTTMATSDDDTSPTIDYSSSELDAVCPRGVAHDSEVGQIALGTARALSHPRQIEQWMACQNVVRACLLLINPRYASNSDMWAVTDDKIDYYLRIGNVMSLFAEYCDNDDDEQCSVSFEKSVIDAREHLVYGVAAAADDDDNREGLRCVRSQCYYSNVFNALAAYCAPRRIHYVSPWSAWLMYALFDAHTEACAARYYERQRQMAEEGLTGDEAVREWNKFRIKFPALYDVFCAFGDQHVRDTLCKEKNAALRESSKENIGVLDKNSTPLALYTKQFHELTAERDRMDAFGETEGTGGDMFRDESAGGYNSYRNGMHTSFLKAEEQDYIDEECISLEELAPGRRSGDFNPTQLIIDLYSLLFGDHGAQEGGDDDDDDDDGGVCEAMCMAAIKCGLINDSIHLNDDASNVSRREMERVADAFRKEVLGGVYLWEFAQSRAAADVAASVDWSSRREARRRSLGWDYARRKVDGRTQWLDNRFARDYLANYAERMTRTFSGICSDMINTHQRRVDELVSMHGRDAAADAVDRQHALSGYADFTLKHLRSVNKYRERTLFVGDLTKPDDSERKRRRRRQLFNPRVVSAFLKAAEWDSYTATSAKLSTSCPYKNLSAHQYALTCTLGTGDDRQQCYRAAMSDRTWDQISLPVQVNPHLFRSKRNNSKTAQERSLAESQRRHDELGYLSNLSRVRAFSSMSSESKTLDAVRDDGLEHDDDDDDDDDIADKCGMGTYFSRQTKSRVSSSVALEEPTGEHATNDEIGASIDAAEVSSKDERETVFVDCGMFVFRPSLSIDDGDNRRRSDGVLRVIDTMLHLGYRYTLDLPSRDDVQTFDDLMHYHCNDEHSTRKNFMEILIDACREHPQCRKSDDVNDITSDRDTLAFGDQSRTPINFNVDQSPTFNGYQYDADIAPNDGDQQVSPTAKRQRHSANDDDGDDDDDDDDDDDTIALNDIVIPRGIEQIVKENKSLAAIVSTAVSDTAEKLGNSSEASDFRAKSPPSDSHGTEIGALVSSSSIDEKSVNAQSPRADVTSRISPPRGIGTHRGRYHYAPSAPIGKYRRGAGGNNRYVASAPSHWRRAPGRQVPQAYQQGVPAQDRYAYAQHQQRAHHVPAYGGQGVPSQQATFAYAQRGLTPSSSSAFTAYRAHQWRGASSDHRRR